MTSPKGMPVSAQIGRFRFEDAAKDIDDGIRRQRPAVDWGTGK